MTRSSRGLAACLGIALAAVAAATASAQRPATRDSMPGMSHSMVSDPLGVSMDRLGSGTTWIPDAVALPARRFNWGRWNLMLHGFAFGQYDAQGGPRGDTQLGSLNWAMLMATHELFGGRFQARTMLSLDAAGVTPRGYPLLLQSGESYDGQPLHDRQHPHDLFMELGVMYDRPITRSLALSLYAAPSGEPALGPVAFMHRPSAMDNLTAPIGHHWQDATHISFGVLTAGVFTHVLRVEGSVFNGREPDQYRFNFDPIRLDSYSGRVSYNPDAHWSLESGYGFIRSPEALDPALSVHRITASVMQGAALGVDGQVATTLIWGANAYSDRPALSHSVLLESEAVLDASNTVLARAEFVAKSAGDLVLDTPVLGFRGSDEFDVGSMSAGYVREILRMRAATLGLGALGTVNVVPLALEHVYGARTPVGLFVFLRLRPLRSANPVMSDMPGVSP